MVGDILPPAVVNIYAEDASTVVVVYDEVIAVDGTYDGISVASSSISGDTVIVLINTFRISSNLFCNYFRNTRCGW